MATLTFPAIKPKTAASENNFTQQEWLQPLVQLIIAKNVWRMTHVTVAKQEDMSSII